MNLLQKFRRENGLDQDGFAAFLREKTGHCTDQGYISNLETGYRSPSLAMASAIEAATNGAVPASSWVQGMSPSPVSVGKDGPYA